MQESTEPSLTKPEASEAQCDPANRAHSESRKFSPQSVVPANFVEIYRIPKPDSPDKKSSRRRRRNRARTRSRTSRTTKRPRMVNNRSRAKVHPISRSRTPRKRSLSDHANPANRNHLKTGQLKDRDVDSGEGVCTHRRHGKRLERRETTASDRVGAIGLALTTHRARDRRAPGDGQWLPESRWHWSNRAKSLGTATAGKTGQRGDHRVGGGTRRPGTATPTPKTFLGKKKAKPQNRPTR